MNEQLKLTYEERAKRATNPAAKKLFNLMAQKKTNLAVAADHTDTNEILELADSYLDEKKTVKIIGTKTDFKAWLLKNSKRLFNYL